jgi:hypothetical protein
MTKEELKAKLVSDPEARKKFIAATSEYYKSVGLTADHQDLAALSTNLNDAARGSIPIVLIVPIVIWPGIPVKGVAKE